MLRADDLGRWGLWQQTMRLYQRRSLLIFRIEKLVMVCARESVLLAFDWQTSNLCQSLSRITLYLFLARLENNIKLFAFVQRHRLKRANHASFINGLNLLAHYFYLLHVILTR